MGELKNFKQQREVATRWVARRRQLMGQDSGQALIMAVIFAALMIALIPVIAIDVTFENSSVVTTVTSEDALAAAEAGIQAYRNNLDNIPGYYAYTSSNPPTGGDAALTGWQSIPNTTPPESFHYLPNDSRLTVASGGSAGQMVLQVTGRAGYAGSYKYRSLLVGFHLSGILTDSYYSEYELNDPNEPGTMPNVTVTPPSGSSYSESMSDFSLPAWSYTAASGYTYNEAAGESLATALCLYHTYDENLWVDSLGSVTNPWVTVSGSHPIANAQNPYYGPYYESSFSYTFPAGSSLAGTSISISAGSPAGVCDAYGVGIYNSSTVFNGIAYTNDQFALCGSPHFNGSPPLVSGAPVNDYLADDWPGTSTVMVGGVPKYEVVGWFDEFHYNGCGGSPQYGSGASPQAATLGGSQHLPSTNQALVQYADGLNGNEGCLYTGPTMIEFVGNGTMNVWSPLTQNTEPDLPNGDTAASCGTFSPSNPWQTGLSLPPDGVIYVQSVPSDPSDPNYWSSIPTVGSGSGQVASGSGTALPSGATCINPYYYNQSASSQYCSEGDALVEGELHGQVTVGSSNYIIQTRDITYACVDGVGAASSTDPSNVSACEQPSTDDVLGLVPQNEFVVAHPTSGGANVGICSDDGTESSPGISNVTPTCDIDNDILDAAVVTIRGSTYVQNFNQGAGLGNLYEEGSNINYFPGFNGVSGGAGYNQNLSYDTRLSYLQPPHILQATDSVWYTTAFVICGSSNWTAGGSIDCPALP